MKRKSLIWTLSVTGAFLICMIVIAFRAQGTARDISDNVLRFHVVANSDSAEDQQLKLKVRDGIVKLSDTYFADVCDKAQAIELAEQNSENIRRSAEEILRQNGCKDAVRVQIKRMNFPTKQYEDITLPAGEYDAIHITIGEGKGENYWCVMFPALCVGSVSDSNEKLLGKVLSPSSLDAVRRPYSFKFKTIELFSRFKQLFK